MWPFVDKEGDGMLFDDDFDDKVGWCARFDHLTNDTIVVGVNQSFVQVEDKGFSSDNTCDEEKNEISLELITRKNGHSYLIDAWTEVKGERIHSGWSDAG